MTPSPRTGHICRHRRHIHHHSSRSCFCGLPPFLLLLLRHSHCPPATSATSDNIRNLSSHSLPQPRPLQPPLALSLCSPSPSLSLTWSLESPHTPLFSSPLQTPPPRLSHMFLKIHFLCLPISPSHLALLLRYQMLSELKLPLPYYLPSSPLTSHVPCHFPSHMLPLPNFSFLFRSLFSRILLSFFDIPLFLHHSLLPSPTSPPYSALPLRYQMLSQPTLSLTRPLPPALCSSLSCYAVIPSLAYAPTALFCFSCSASVLTDFVYSLHFLLHFQVDIPSFTFPPCFFIPHSPILLLLLIRIHFYNLLLHYHNRYQILSDLPFTHSSPMFIYIREFSYGFISKF